MRQLNEGDTVHYVPTSLACLDATVTTNRGGRQGLLDLAVPRWTLDPNEPLVLEGVSRNPKSKEGVTSGHWHLPGTERDYLEATAAPELPAAEAADEGGRG